MKKKNAVFLRNKIYSEVEGIEVEGLCKHFSRTKYVDLVILCTCV